MQLPAADENGNPILDEHGNPVMVLVTIPRNTEEDTEGQNPDGQVPDAQIQPDGQVPQQAPVDPGVPVPEG